MTPAAPFRQLGGLLEIGSHTPEELRAQCRLMRKAGFTEAYLGDVFLEMVPHMPAPPAERIVFRETDGFLLLRAEEQIVAVRDLVRAEGLAIASAHYNQVLSPPGEHPAAWLADYHRAMVKRAALLGLRRFTTHPGWMFGSAEERCTGAAARAYRERRLTLTELNHQAYLRYGGEASVWRDSVELYRILCALAAGHGITVTLETAISEWYPLTLHPERLRAFIAEVGAPNLGICVDSGHCHLNGLDVATVIRACGELLVETHFHDNHGQRDEHNPLGDGTIDWPAVIRALRAVGYGGSITFEQRDHARNAERWTAYLDQSASDT
jgi:sugar phosphate isomerase/epimerase